MTAGEVRAALRRHYGLTASDLAMEEWTLHDEVSLARFGGVTIDMLAIRAWGGKPKGHERHAVEIKVSRADLARELRSGKWRPWFDVTHRFYFAVPSSLTVSLGEIPDGCGLITISDRGYCSVDREATRRDPEPLDEVVWVDLARRASRLAERLRRPVDPAAELAALQLEHARVAAALLRARSINDRLRHRLTLLLNGIPQADVVCSTCQSAMTFRREPGHHRAWRWRHDAEPDRYCVGQPVPRDLLDAELVP